MIQLLSGTALAEAPARPIATTDIRVLHVITGMQKGGAEKVATQLSRARDERAGIAWLKGGNTWQDAFEGSRVELNPIGMRGLRDLPRAAGRLVRLMRRFKPDIVHTHLVHAHVVGRWAARRAGGVPVVSTEHNLRVYSRTDQRWLEAMDIRSGRRNAAVVAISEAARSRCIESGFRRDTLHVVHNGVEVPDAFPPSPNGPRIVVTMVGRLLPAKGPDLFIRALGELPHVDGILVGDGEERSLIESLIRGMRDPRRLTWHPQGDAMDAISKADIVVMPSRHEGLGLVALEAMAMERPVVATRVGGLVEVIEEGVTGKLVAPECVSALVEAISALIEDPAQRRSMGRAGRRRVKERFTLQGMLQAYEQIYQSVRK